VPLGLLVAYGALRLASTAFTELREFVFAKVTQRAVRTIALQVFRHLHALSLRFHLERQTGGLTRDIERGTRGISSAGVSTRCTASCPRWSRSRW
jgi:ABC-type bacteriocin/lantibiotic exporter with double-glycine peptidase domain